MMSESLRLTLSIVSLVLALGSLGVTIWALFLVSQVRSELDIRGNNLEPRSKGNVEFRRPWDEHP